MNDPNDPLSPQSNDSQKRLLTALALSFVATTVYMFFFAPKPPEAEAGADGGVVAAGPVDAGTPVAQAPAVPTPGTAGTPAEAAPAEPAPPARTVELKRDHAIYRFSSEGAGLASVELQGDKMREQQNLTVAEGYRKLLGHEIASPPQMNLAQPVPGAPLPLAVGIEGPVPFNPKGGFAVTEEANGEGVTFVGRQGPWEVRKALRWPRAGFEMLYTVEVRNTSAQALSGELQVHYGRAIDPNHEHAPSWLGGVGNQSRAACWVDEELHKLVPDDKPPEDDKGLVHYFGIDQQYFLSALYPLEGPRQGHCVLTATPTERSVRAGFPLTVEAGQTVTLRFGGYLGPKETDYLREVPGADVRAVAGQNAATFHPELEKTVDFGIWAVICKLLLAILKFFYGVTGNWGVAIILLTVVVKLALLPLTHRSMVSMESVKKLQPRMEEIRKKFKDDKERQNLEVMKLYQEAKVNPLGGCLPILIQMPVWIALFTALRNSFDIYWEPFFGPVWRDLTYKDPTYILPVLLGVSMVVMQKMQPQMTMDPAQARMMTWVLPIIFTATLFQYPAGLALYIFTNNVLSVVQQYGLRKWIERGGGDGGKPAPAATGGKAK
ncbi:membrane protein insertase YidC [Myxococcaceae bacterium GXIMD 01537]